MAMQLQSIVLFVLNLDESRVFYEDVLGLTVQATSDTRIEYQRWGHTVSGPSSLRGDLLSSSDWPRAVRCRQLRALF